MSKKDNIKHPLQKTVYDIGYIGMGKYNTSDNLVLYDKWSGILRRCCDKKFQEKHNSYKDCIVDERWHNFQNFAEWFEENYNSDVMQGWQLDKDILFKGNKIYSPETCCFVPQEINSLFVKRDNDRKVVLYEYNIVRYFAIIENLENSKSEDVIINTS